MQNKFFSSSGQIPEFSRFLPTQKGILACTAAALEHTHRISCICVCNIILAFMVSFAKGLLV